MTSRKAGTCRHVHNPVMAALLLRQS